MKKILIDRPPSDFKTWKSLKNHQKKIAPTTIREHFRNETNRLDYTWLEWENFIVDVSKKLLIPLSLMFLVLFLATYFPKISLYLPSTVLGYK